MEKRKINISLIDTNKPHDTCDTYFVKTILTDEELQEIIYKHKDETDGDYDTDTMREVFRQHKDIEFILCDFEGVDLAF